MTRTIVAAALAAGLSCCSFIATGASAADAPAKKLNVLLILSDDLNTHLGCYGDSVVKTPHLDALAARGVRFDRAYCQYPVCNPSRTSFLSSLRPEATKVLDQPTMLRRDRVQDAVYLPEHFKAQGYFTAGIGKVEHAGHHEIAWDFADDFKSGGGGGADDEDEAAPRPRRAQSRPSRGAARRNPEVLTYEVKRATADGDPENVDDRIAASTIKLLEEHRDKPFFIVAGFHKPHVPHVAPKRFFDLYPPEKMPLTEVPAGDADDIPRAALASRRNYQPDMSPQRRRDIISAYNACTSYMDEKVGDVLAAVDRLKLWDDTVVVFLGDHGWHFGEHDWWAKASLFEPSARAPLIVVAPGVKSASCGRVVEFLDLAPTLADLCGLPPMTKAQGKSIRPLLEDSRREWDHAAYTALGIRGRSVRDERYRYTEWEGGKAGVELYDYETDPGEHTNLAADEKSADVVMRMKALLARVN